MYAETSFGRWLKAERKARDLTQDGLGQQVGCAGETIRKIEAGAARPSRQVADLLAAYFGVPPADRPAFAQWARTLPAAPGARAGAAWDAPVPPAPAAPPARARVFICYERDADPDQAVALQILQALSREHDVFADQALPGGAHWAQQLEDALERADYVIPCCSARSVQNEMLLAEIGQATRLAQARGRPAILPVRLAYREPLGYPWSPALDPMAGITWQDHGDTPAVVATLRRALAGAPAPADQGAPPRRPQAAPAVALPAPAPFAQPVALEMPEGTMDPQSAFYVDRPSDALAGATIRQPGVTITIKGPRQMGKSSLLYRLTQAAEGQGKRVVLLDFQLFDQAALTSAERFFRQFCAWLSDELGLEERTAEYWRLPLSNIQRCTNYMKKYLLPQLAGSLVLAMDEVDRVFETDFRSDFFGMLRSWHNTRQATIGAGPGLWKRLDLVLVTSTEPYQFIDNLNQSPFNVGCIVDLEDLGAAQVADLNRRHGSPLTMREEAQLMALVGGQPYLVRRALYLVAAGQIGAAALLAAPAADRGPFGDHLRYHLFRLHEKPELVAGLRSILRQQSCPDERIFFRLQGAGLVTREGATVRPRYQLYADYFQEHLHG